MRRLLPTPENDVDPINVYAILTDAPHLRVQFVSSVDGAASAGGASAGLSSDTDRQLLLTLRALSDGVLVGAGTARAENYGGVKLSDELRAHRRSIGKLTSPPVIVVTRSADLDPTMRLFVETTTPPIVLTTEAAAPAARLRFGVLAEVVAAGDSTVDLAIGLAALREKGHLQLHCEGGPSLFGDLLAADLVDELCLTTSPIVAGPGAPRIISGADPIEPPRVSKLTDLFTDDQGFLFARHSLR